MSVGWRGSLFLGVRNYAELILGERLGVQMQCRCLQYLSSFSGGREERVVLSQIIRGLLSVYDCHGSVRPAENNARLAENVTRCVRTTPQVLPSNKLTFALQLAPKGLPLLDVIFTASA